MGNMTTCKKCGVEFPNGEFIHFENCPPCNRLAYKEAKKVIDANWKDFKAIKELVGLNVECVRCGMVQHYRSFPPCAIASHLAKLHNYVVCTTCNSTISRQKKLHKLEKQLEKFNAMSPEEQKAHRATEMRLKREKKLKGISTNRDLIGTSQKACISVLAASTQNEWENLTHMAKLVVDELGVPDGKTYDSEMRRYRASLKPLVPSFINHRGTYSLRLDREPKGGVHKAILEVARELSNGDLIPIKLLIAACKKHKEFKGYSPTNVKKVIDRLVPFYFEQRGSEVRLQYVQNESCG